MKFSNNKFKITYTLTYTYNPSNLRCRQEGQKFKVILGYLSSWRLPWAILDPVFPASFPTEFGEEAVGWLFWVPESFATAL